MKESVIGLGRAVIYCATFLLKQQILRNLEGREQSRSKVVSKELIILFGIKEALPLFVQKYFLYLYVLNFHVGVNLNHCNAQS